MWLSALLTCDATVEEVEEEEEREGAAVRASTEDTGPISH
jgi:hypothetical protein